MSALLGTAMSPHSAAGLCPQKVLMEVLPADLLIRGGPSFWYITEHVPTHFISKKRFQPGTCGGIHVYRAHATLGETRNTRLTVVSRACTTVTWSP